MSRCGAWTSRLALKRECFSSSCWLEWGPSLTLWLKSNTLGMDDPQDGRILGS